MTDQVIPDEAVEAAVTAYLKEYNFNAEEIVQLVLEAAAPHLTERAYNAGHLDGMNGSPNANPYGKATR
jgi:hypothetical protein